MIIQSLRVITIFGGGIILALWALMPLVAAQATSHSNKEANMTDKPTQEYRGNGNHQFEHVQDGMMRLRVPGGWLYCVVDERGDIMSQAFVPMPEVVKHKV